MALFKKGPLGHTLFIKCWLIRIFGFITHSRYDGFNQSRIESSDIVRSLPPQDVLFISNHQTYFTDATVMYHVFNTSLKGCKDTLDNVRYLWNPKLNIYCVAASEAMKSGMLPKMLGYAGAILASGTWREKRKEVHREVCQSDVGNIGVALTDGWIVTFSQRTASPWKPVWKGTAYLIKQYKPAVVPTVIGGFRCSFDKKSINTKEKGVQQSMIIKSPLQIDYEDDTIEQIVAQIEMAIGQRESFLKVGKLESDSALQVKNKQ